MGLPRTIQLMKSDNINKYRGVRVDEFNMKLNSSLNALGVNYIDIYNIGCDIHCKLITKDGVPMLFDSDHLTHQWAIKAFKIIKNSLN